MSKNSTILQSNTLIGTYNQGNAISNALIVDDIASIKMKIEPTLSENDVERSD